MAFSNDRGISIAGRSAVLVFAACVAGAVAWCAPELRGRTPPRPVLIQLLDWSERVSALVGLSEGESRLAGLNAGTRGSKTLRLVFGEGETDLPMAEVRQIEVRPVERMVIRSDSSVDTLHLGKGPTRKAEPPGWHLPETIVLGWQPAVTQEWLYYGWRYVPQATWIWANGSRRQREDETVLFRQQFQLPTTMTLVQAQLDISADNQVETFFVNGKSVGIPARSLLGEVSQWDVTHLLRPGRNVVAARVSNDKATGQLNYAGLSYRIVCDLAPGEGPTAGEAPGVRLFLANGDHLSGHLESISAKQWLIRRGSRVLEIDPDWLELCLVNYEAGAAAPMTASSSRRTLLPPWKVFVTEQRLRPAITLGARAAFMWRRDVRPTAAQQGLLLRNGDWIDGRIEGLQANQILIKPRYGEAFGVAVDRVAAVQPNRPDPETQFLFHPGDFPYIACARLINNDQLTGALESLTADVVTIAPHFSNRVALDLDEVLSIRFIMNDTARYRQRLTQAWPAGVPRQIAAIGEPGSGPGGNAAIEEIQRTLVNLGLELNWLDAYQMAEAGMLVPERFPVLINLDQNERYFHSVRKEGDGFEAIRRYVEEGGTLVHLARGAPFGAAFGADKGRWSRLRRADDLNAALGMDIVSRESRSREARPFQLPPNRGQHMVFVLNERTAMAEGLPPRVEMPMAADARFRPITDDRVTSRSRFTPIYRLVDDAGTDYGVAMGVVHYGSVRGRPHYGVYVSHLLYEASAEGKPMIAYLLPKVLDLALGGQEVSMANLAVAPNGALVPSARAQLKPPEKPAAPDAP